MNNPPSKEVLYIAIMTAITGSIMILRNLSTILKQIGNILSEYQKFLQLKNERQLQELQERRLRTAFWMDAIRRGKAMEKLNSLDEKINK